MTLSVPLVDLPAQYANIQAEVDAAMQAVLASANFILGPEVRAFEQEFSSFVGTAGAAGVASGSSALLLALLACGVGQGDEVITTAFTFMATAEAISLAGARPVFVDIDPRTYNLDPERVAEAITPRTKAILPVHLYGQAADMDALASLAQRHHLWLIEDAAQAHGATWSGRLCGNFGHLACFSFYPGKNLGAYGDAGAVTGNDEALLAKVRRLRDHGRTAKYEHQEVGFGERLDALQAAVLRVKLRHLPAWNAARQAHAQAYTSALAGCEVITPYQAPQAGHVYHLYVVRSRRRDALLQYLRTHGVAAGIHYPLPLHRQPAYLSLGYNQVSLPITDQAANEVLSLPMYAELTDQQIAYVVDVVRSFEHEGSDAQQ